VRGLLARAGGRVYPAGAGGWAVGSGDRRADEVEAEEGGLPAEDAAIEGSGSMSDHGADELFYERQRRVECELRAERKLSGDLIRQLGERDVEIARLREALQAIVVECDGWGDGRERAMRSFALGALAAPQGGSGERGER